jgi:flavin reductase (DIM6/NTAB) family NADH-FMN oxidoreductase RutF
MGGVHPRRGRRENRALAGHRGRPLDGVAHHPGRVTGAPLLDGALATLECRTAAVYDGGDHSIIVGQVAAVTGTEGPSRGPLMHYAGAYRRLPES